MMSERISILAHLPSKQLLDSTPLFSNIGRLSSSSLQAIVGDTQDDQETNGRENDDGRVAAIQRGADLVAELPREAPARRGALRALESLLQVLVSRPSKSFWP